MVEQAEMMLDGTLCSDCGGYVGKQSDGIPQQCGCWNSTTPTARKKGEPRKVTCPHCERICKKGQSLTDHMRDVHGVVNGKPSIKGLAAENERLREAMKRMEVLLKRILEAHQMSTVDWEAMARTKDLLAELAELDKEEGEQWAR